MVLFTILLVSTAVSVMALSSRLPAAMSPVRIRPGVRR
jgi:hypothetical protein